MTSLGKHMVSDLTDDEPTGCEAANEVWSDLASHILARMIPTLTWRHHGLGVYQAYIHEGGDHETRVHIFHPDLVLPGLADTGDIHDHRFDLVSHVLTGRIEHRVYTEVPAGIVASHKRNSARPSFESYDVYECVHARLGQHDPITTSRTANFQSQDFAFLAGYVYAFKAGHFHCSTVRELTVTVMEKHNQSDTRARILCPSGKPIVQCFGNALNHDPVKPEYLHMAVEALLR